MHLETSTRRRLGKFTVPYRLLEKPLHTLTFFQELMSKVIIITVKHDPQTDTVTYTARSKGFDMIEGSAKIPKYEPIFHHKDKSFLGFNRLN